MIDEARQALQEWWDTIPPAPLVEALKHQEDAETVSLHDIRHVMEFLLERTDTLPSCLGDTSEELTAIFAPLRQMLRMQTQITAQINPVQLLTPDQVGQEKAHFQEALRTGQIYNPQFTYRTVIGDLKKSLEKTPGVRHATTWDALLAMNAGFHEHILLLEQHLDHPVIKVIIPLLHAKIDDDQAALELAKALDEESSEAIAVALSKLYAAPTAMYIEAAQQLTAVIHQHPTLLPWIREVMPNHDPLLQKLEQDTAPASVLKDITERATQMYYDYVTQMWPDPLPSSLRFSVEMDEKYVNFDVRDKSSQGPVIGIPDRPRTWIGMFALCRHEIDMHVRQSLNGALLYGFGGGMLKLNPEDLYEGTALYAERQFTMKIRGIAQVPSLPYATLVYEAARSGKSFYEAFHMLLQELPEELLLEERQDRAWNITYRIYRGRLDTGKGLAYGCAKDTGYLRGAIVTHKLHAAGLEYLLDFGVVPLDMLPIHRRLKRDMQLPYPDLNTAETLLHDYFPTLRHGS